MTKRRFWCWTLLAALGVLASAYGLRRPAMAWLARHWQNEMATAAEPRAIALVARVDGLGESGLPVLVQSLGSPRAGVARAARQALSARLDEWKSLDARRAAPKLARLAQNLAAEVEPLGPAARLDAAELAVRILHRPLDSQAVDVAGVIADCEEVLRVARSGRQEVTPSTGRLSSAARDAAPPNGSAPLSLGPVAAERDRTQERLPPLEPAIPELAALPGGNLPADPLDKESGEEMPANPRPSADTLPEEPRWLDRPAGARPLESRGQAPRLLGEAASPSRPIGKPAAPSQPRQRPSAEWAAPLGSPSRDREANRPLSLEESQAASTGLAAARTLDLIRGLRGEGAAAARAELARRGLGEVDLAVGRQLSDPDPEVRKRLARTLPGMKSVNPEPWLLWLAQDPSGEVRETAVGLLATSNDPALLAEVERLARADSDARVRRHADLIARRRAEERL